MDWTSNSRERRTHVERSIKEGRRYQEKVWAVSRRNKVWFRRSNHAVSSLSKKGNHARCSLYISSTWNPYHVWPHHRWTNKWNQKGEEKGRLVSLPRVTWILPRDIWCYEAPHNHSIRCVLAWGNRGQRPHFHQQDSKINAGALANEGHETHPWGEARQAKGNIISLADGRRRLDLLQQAG